jgi:hypothetical protein
MTPPRDVEVLVVGDADEDDLADAALAAERRRGTARAVFTADRWADVEARQPRASTASAA